MTAVRRQIYLVVLKAFDLLNASLMFILSMVIASYQIGTASFGQFFATRFKVQNFAIFLGFLFVWHTIFSFFDLYHSKRLSPNGREFIDIVKGSSLGTLVVSLFAVLFRIEIVTPLFLIVFWAMSSASTFLVRSILRSALNKVRVRHKEPRYLLIVGTNEKAVQFARKIESNSELGYRIIGFIDDKWSKIGEFKKTDYTLIGKLSEFPEVLRNRVVDEVVVFLSLKSFYRQISWIVSICENHGIIVRYLYSLFNMKLARSKTEQFEGEPAITLYTGNLDEWAVVIKRALDFLLSLMLIVPLTPFFLIVALVIKITSPGPVFFIQERVGFNKRIFKLYKFRTMISDAENKQNEMEHLNEVSGPVFKIKNDPRITVVGKFLRKTSIDELPQLFNVLKGDMSIVGPRPLPMRDFEGFDQDWHRRRFSVHPGITCLWQISGRSDMPFERWMELDMEYIDNWSLGLDLKILAKTIPAVLRGSGAA